MIFYYEIYYKKKYHQHGIKRKEKGDVSQNGQKCPLRNVPNATKWQNQ